MQDPIPSDYDLYLFHEGSLFRSYEMLGSQVCISNGKPGVRFSVWAPHATQIRVVGSFNDWNGSSHVMTKLDPSGVWTLFVPGIAEGELYKYEITTNSGEIFLKSDPYAVYSECRPHTASIVYSLRGYQWQDESWQTQKRQFCNHIDNKPLNIYEVHLGSWKRTSTGDFYSYRELAHDLIPYVREMGYTHIEIMPLTEHPYDRSWGYQSTGYYSVSSRFGTPFDFMYFIDSCHQSGIGVILDWVPGHFAKDAHGLRMFDGSPLYEYQDPVKAEKRQWGTSAFDLSKPEVKSFLISNALFWLELYHIDGLRVDAVSSMLYLDFDKQDGEWTPNRYGGRENLEAIRFLQTLNQSICQYAKGTVVIAEESTDWQGVTARVEEGGLGFHFKWNMGWMNDTLRYMERDPIYRNYHHQELTFSILYVYSERFILPFSHDEVVHGKRSLLNKMPGDEWRRFAGLRALLGYMMTHPGKKLLFMGSEFGQFDEWKDETQLDWHLLDFEMHLGMQRFVRDLNHFYLDHPALWELDHHPDGFAWIDPHNRSQSVLTYMRKPKMEGDALIIICNFTPQTHIEYRIGVPKLTTYREVFNSDCRRFGGSNQRNVLPLIAEELPWHNQSYSIVAKIPPLSVLILQQTR
jgi:1,4-alpha-glucan branching enzyme